MLQHKHLAPSADVGDRPPLEGGFRLQVSRQSAHNQGPEQTERLNGLADQLWPKGLNQRFNVGKFRHQ